MRHLRQLYLTNYILYALFVFVVSTFSAVAQNITRLENGVAITSLKADRDESLLFSITVPDETTALTIKSDDFIPGGFSINCFGDGGYSYCAGDSVLYVKQGSIPTLSDYDCVADDSRNRGYQNEAECTFTEPQSGIYYIRLFAKTDFYSASLEATYKENTSAKTYSVADLSVSRGQWIDYSLMIPEGTAELKVEMSGGTGDADLYVADENYDFVCYPWLDGNHETCTFSNPVPGKWWVFVHGYRFASGVNIKASVKPEK